MSNLANIQFNNEKIANYSLKIHDFLLRSSDALHIESADVTSDGRDDDAIRTPRHLQFKLRNIKWWVFNE